MMEKKKLLFRIVFLMLFMFAVDRLAHSFFWYYTIWWFDMPMHFLGGVWVSLFFVYIFFKEESFAKLALKVMLSLFCIGILWEVFEFATNNVIGRDPFNALDTVSDIFFDLAGGFFALFYFLKSSVTIFENKIQLN